MLEKEISRTDKALLDCLAPDIGKVRVINIERDGCSACERQKPRLNKLAAAIEEKHGDRVHFTRIHVKRPPDSDEESLRSKDVLGHYFYPTSLILMRTRDRGTIELYRNVSPSMEELEKSIEIAVEIVTLIERESI